MRDPDDATTELDDTAVENEATEADGEAAPAADPVEAQRKLESLLALWRAGVATVPAVARRDAGTTGPIAVADDDDDDDDDASRDVVTSWWSMPKVRAAG